MTYPPPPYPPQQPPYPAPQPPRPQGRSTLKIVLIVVGAVLTLCCVGGIVGGYFLYQGVSEATAPVRGAANDYLADVEAARYDAAYDRLCADTRRRITRQEFAATLAGETPKPVEHSLSGFNISTVNGVTTGSVTAVVTYDDGSKRSHSVELVKEGDAWKVCGQPY